MCLGEVVLPVVLSDPWPSSWLLVGTVGGDALDRSAGDPRDRGGGTEVSVGYRPNRRVRLW